MRTGQRVAVAGVLVLAGSVAPLSTTASATASDGSGGWSCEAIGRWLGADSGDPPRAPHAPRGFDEGTSQARLESRIAELRARIAAAIDQWDLQRMQVLELQLAALVRRMECGSSGAPVHSGPDARRPWWMVTPVQSTIIRI